MEEKINTYFYVFYNAKEKKYFVGFNQNEQWCENLEYCCFRKDIVQARQIKKSILDLYDIDCKILKVDLLEVI